MDSFSMNKGSKIWKISVCYKTWYVFFAVQEGYSVARQFNLIPPIAEQAEYHIFQREKVEMQMPELYNKIGKTFMGLQFMYFCIFTYTK